MMRKRDGRSRVAKLTMVAKILLIVCWIWIGVDFVTLGSGLSTKQLDANPDVARPDEINDYDPEVRIDEPCENVSLDGIDYDISFLQYDNDSGSNIKLEDLNRKVGDGSEFYKVALRVKNNTDKVLSCAKLFIKLPDSIGEHSVVADEMTLSAQLEYDGVVAQKQLNLMGDDSPIEVAFLGGAASVIWRGDSEGEDLPIYDDLTASLLDYWKNEGFELEIPAGEEWELHIKVWTHKVADFEVRSKITSVDGKYSGKNLAAGVIFGQRERFHVAMEIANSTDLEQSTAIWITFDLGAELVPGSMRFNGEQIDDFVVQDSGDKCFTFEGVDLGINPPNGIMKLEYDVEMADIKKDHVTLIRSIVGVGELHGSAGGSYASTMVGCRVYDHTTIGLFLVGVSVVVAFITIIIIAPMFIKRGRRNAE